MPSVFSLFDPPFLSDYETAIRNDWHGAYNTLFNSLFFPSEGYLTCPLPQQQYVEGTGVLHMALTFLVQKPIRDYKELVTVFVLEVKAWKDLSDDFQRKLADTYMRRRLDELGEKANIPRMYGLSAMGHSIAIYSREKDTGIITPSTCDVDPEMVPKEWWDCDLRSSEGQEKFEELAREVKEMSKNLQ